MCGIVAAAGRVDADIVENLIAGARRRGPDMLGIVWTERGRWGKKWARTPSWPEPAEVAKDAVKRMAAIQGRRIVLAHARLATSGNGALEDAQPLHLGDLMFAHNGTVYSHRELASRWEFPLDTLNDSEALGRMFQITRDPGNTMRYLEEHQGPTRHAWAAATLDQLWIASWGQPLWVRRQENLLLASSWRFYRADLLPPRSSLEFTLTR